MVIQKTMKLSHLNTRLETILDRAFANSQTTSNRSFELIGLSSSFCLAHLFSQSYSKNVNDLPHLVVLPSLEEAESFNKKLKSFHCPYSSSILSHHDVSPYSTLLPNEQVSKNRIRFFNQAQHAKPGEIFLAPIQSLLQKSVPFNFLSSHSFVIREGDEIPSDLSKKLIELGYQLSPLAEDQGMFSVRGGIIDIFSPAHDFPVRIELFGDMVESMRFFSPETQRTIRNTSLIQIIPSHEVLYSDDNLEKVIFKFKKSAQGRPVVLDEIEDIVRSISRKSYFPGIDFMLPFFYEKLSSPLDHFSSPLNVWLYDPVELSRQFDLLVSEMKIDFEKAESVAIRPDYKDIFETTESIESLPYPEGGRLIKSSKINIHEDFSLQNNYDLSNDSFNLSSSQKSHEVITYKSFSTLDFSNIFSLDANNLASDEKLKKATSKLTSWKKEGYHIFIFSRNHQQSERVKIILDKMNFDCSITNDDEFLLDEWSSQQNRNLNLFHVLPLYLDESIRLAEEKIIYLRDEDFFGKKSRLKSNQAEKEFQKQVEKLNFGDLVVGDFIVHIKHGIGQYEGLKKMLVNGVESEFLQLSYKDKNKLYLPVYRVGQIQKYASAAAAHVGLDKLGGTSWEKAKVKVKSHLKDVASELLNLYAQRSQLTRPPFSAIDNDYKSFEGGFPYDETDDQLRAIKDIIKDMTGPRPMDRLVCGDVGFGKTEVAMRAAFKAIQDHKQVALLAPTTVLSFQHLETLRKRFSGWPVEIRALNRFLTPAEVKKTLQDLKDGRVDIIVGTHRLLSKDVLYKNLGLLIIDEEQRFGVVHKERLKKIKTNVDTLTLSATPIPRTLNMSLVGIRDLSFITTPPVDRLPTRTFTCKFESETIRKAILAEIQRGGQVYFIHNRVQSIYSLCDELRQLVPEARIKVAHGQMEEDQLEETMVAFFNHDIDVLLSTTIVESGMDVSRANTIFIDQAHQLGLSQLYQLRGRVGRSKQRAYCYLLIPKGKSIDKDAQERLRVIQENTALGSGLRIAQHDLEMRGAGNILGEEQSGHINLVGYDLYMDLLNDALRDAKGETSSNMDLDPEINLKIPALIPDQYIADIRLRLGYYKALSNITSQNDLSDIEDELKDQFGPLPEQVLNLMGIMLLRYECKQLGVKDLSTGLKTLSLSFSENTPLKPETAISLAMRENKKYSLAPDNRLIIRMNNQSIQNIYDELDYLKKLAHV